MAFCLLLASAIVAAASSTFTVQTSDGWYASVFKGVPISPSPISEVEWREIGGSWFFCYNSGVTEEYQRPYGDWETHALPNSSQVFFVNSYMSGEGHMNPVLTHLWNGTEPFAYLDLRTCYPRTTQRKYDGKTGTTLLDPLESERTYSSRKSGLTDSQLSRLDSTKAWSPATAVADEWVQMDLGAVLRVTGVQIQKAADQTTEYVTQVQVDVSEDGTTFRTAFTSTADLNYTSDGKSVVDFVVVDFGPVSFLAKLVKIYVKAFEKGIAMRVGVHTPNCSWSGEDDTDCPAHCLKPEMCSVHFDKDECVLDKRCLPEESRLFPHEVGMGQWKAHDGKCLEANKGNVTKKACEENKPSQQWTFAEVEQTVMV